MPALRLSRRARLTKQIGRDPGEVIHELVYMRDRTLKEAGQHFGVTPSTAMRWMDDWMKDQGSPVEPAQPEAVPA